MLSHSRANDLLGLRQSVFSSGKRILWGNWRSKKFRVCIDTVCIDWNWTQMVL